VSTTHTTLSRRERQIMDVLYRKGRATASDVMQGLSDPPGNATIRTLLRILEEKGHVRHERDGARFVFLPTVHPETAKRSAIRHLVQTFFGGSAARAVTALLDSDDFRMSKEDAARLKKLIRDSRGGNSK
jgi:predicted transcriptional regulator